MLTRYLAFTKSIVRIFIKYKCKLTLRLRKALSLRS